MLAALANPPIRQRLASFARLAISIALLAVLVTSADVQALWRTLQAANVWLYLACIPISTAGMGLRALRWYVTLKAVGARVSFRRVFYLCYVGAFFNTFLPSGLGGDVIRVLEIGPGATSQQATGTILTERMAGFAVLFGLAAVALPFSAQFLPPLTVWLIGALTAGVLGATALLLEGKLLRRIMARLPRAISLAGDTWLGQTYDVITQVGWRALGVAALISLIFNGSIVFSNWLVTRAFGLDVPLWAVAVILPIIAATLLVPISISGFGVREGVVVALLLQIGVNAEQGLLLSLAWYGLDVIDGLFGGMIYFLTGLLGLRPRPAAPQISV
jgi:hypothetical protein